MTEPGSSIPWEAFDLLVAERRQRIEPRRPARRKIAGGEGRGREKE